MLVGHPLDLVKVRMQTGGGGGAGTLKLLQTTFASEGVTGLYRGVSAPIIAIAPVFAVCFWGYDMGKRVVRAVSVSPNSSPNDPLTISQLSVAGALSAIPTTAIMAPSERIKCLLQVQANEIAKGGVAKYTGVTDCAVQVYKEGGLRSVFKGSFATVSKRGIRPSFCVHCCTVFKKSPHAVVPAFDSLCSYYVMFQEVLPISGCMNG